MVDKIIKIEQHEPHYNTWMNPGLGLLMLIFVYGIVNVMLNRIV